MMRKLVAALMAGFGIAGVVLLAHLARLPISAVPFATSMVLVAGSPHHKAAAPRATVLGHFTCAMVGMIARALLGPHPLGAAIAVAVAVALMLLLGAFHPPAGVTPLIIFEADPDYGFLVTPIASGIALVVALQRFSSHLQGALYVRQCTCDGNSKGIVEIPRQ